MKGGRNKGVGTLVLFLVTGAVLGGVLGEVIAGSTLMAGIVPYLIKTYPVFDFPPVTINLYVLRLVIGFAFHPNLISLLGVIVALVLFRRF
ncbi:DUF4321 domain-containing protein [Sporolituus thermophilus]|uniref:DUF4321 domain-containing protein n=1 Tax=Sporolituus thermophilus DSM 23256 TaxID=1123285 RepID=A0A1G7J8D2_9FIRM|nr:DUF4321 domain-containing protein [Sporolituus thermophilus]SDF21133.1 protein of unknown function [Sporolituus thermophilus DSM 23256]